MIIVNCGQSSWAGPGPVPKRRPPGENAGTCSLGPGKRPPSQSQADSVLLLELLLTAVKVARAGLCPVPKAGRQARAPAQL
eukprot:6999306-Heterocapsa_arctica.AAC.1